MVLDYREAVALERRAQGGGETLRIKLVEAQRDRFEGECVHRPETFTAGG